MPYQVYSSSCYIRSTVVLESINICLSLPFSELQEFLQVSIRSCYQVFCWLDLDSHWWGTPAKRFLAWHEFQRQTGDPNRAIVQLPCVGYAKLFLAGGVFLVWLTHPNTQPLIPWHAPASCLRCNCLRQLAGAWHARFVLVLGLESHEHSDTPAGLVMRF